ncbi:MAG TPA: hypothetical protein VHM19_18630 [Polyangiales bacterium]|jgi:hypothetical protein|nr:hypothetical protein [Polyangiales bacterium]
MIGENETPEQKAMREQLQRMAAGIAGMVKHTLQGAECGFAVILFDFGKGGNMAYASDGQRADMMRALRELLGKMEMDALVDGRAQRSDA